MVASETASTRARTSRCTRRVALITYQSNAFTRGAGAALQQRVQARLTFHPFERMHVRIDAYAAGILFAQRAGHWMPVNSGRPLGQPYWPKDETIAFRIVQAHRHRTIACHNLENACVDAILLDGLRIHEIVNYKGKRPDSATGFHKVSFHRPGSRGHPPGNGIDEARVQAEPGGQAPERRQAIIPGQRNSRGRGLKLGDEAHVGERVIERAICFQTERIAVAPWMTDARCLEI